MAVVSVADCVVFSLPALFLTLATENWSSAVEPAGPVAAAPPPEAWPCPWPWPFPPSGPFLRLPSPTPSSPSSPKSLLRISTGRLLRDLRSQPKILCVMLATLAVELGVLQLFLSPLVNSNSSSSAALALALAPVVPISNCNVLSFCLRRLLTFRPFSCCCDCSCCWWSCWSSFCCWVMLMAVLKR